MPGGRGQRRARPASSRSGRTPASFLLPRNPGRLGPWGYFLVNTPTVIATVDAALAAAVAVLAVRGSARANWP
jgi:hypothetical protein